MAAPICAISLTGITRSSRAISESRSVAGMVMLRAEPRVVVAIARVLQLAGFENGLGQLLHEQRHPVGLGQDLLEQVGGQRFAPGQLAIPSRCFAPG